jgi:predicted SprT family Zn-dependent metalloprotease
MARFLSASPASLAAAEAELRGLTARLTRAWRIPPRALEVTLRSNPRLSRCVARYRRDARVIELGPRFFRLRARRPEVLCHELAHAAVDHLHGTGGKPHGADWQHLIQLAGFATNAHLPRAPHAADVRTRKSNPATAHYVHRCPVCHMTRRAKRPVKQWRCRECTAAGLSGELEIERIRAR